MSNLKTAKILVTGAAGFIGFHLCQRLIKDGHEVVGLDSINAYYDVKLKYDRLKECGISKDSIKDDGTVASNTFPNFRFTKGQLEDSHLIKDIFEVEQFDYVINLAAQAGVRHSLKHPHAYIQSNIIGFMNLLEQSRYQGVKHLLYASSSSVYGLNQTMPLSTADNVDHPISIYAATKKANESMAHSYSHLYQLPTTGLRFFSVYGPWGRPDMALFIFTRQILNGEPIEVFNQGDMVRDFTYVDDIIEGIVRLMDHIPEGNADWSGFDPDPASSRAPWKIYNIGNQSEVPLMTFVEEIEAALGKKAEVIKRPIQPGDVPMTKADVSDLQREVGYKPSTTVRDGIGKFIDWYRTYYSR